MPDSGFYLMHRGWQDHPVFGSEPYSKRDAFEWLISHATYAPRDIGVSGKVIRLERGQLTYSLRYMARAWKWSEPKVRRFLAKMRDSSMIGLCSEIDAGQTVVTVCNYDRYQVAPEETDAGPTQDRRRSDANNKEGNKEDITTLGRSSSKKRRRSWRPPADFDADFEQAWALYPKRDGGNPRATAFKAWKARIAEGANPEDLFHASVNYGRYMQSKGKVGTEYVLQAATFYGPGERWKEYIRPVRLSAMPTRELLSGEATVQKTRAMVSFEDRKRKEAS